MSTKKATPTKYDHYAKWTDGPMLVLALVFLVVWSARIIGSDELPSSIRNTLLSVQGLIWIAFIVDIVVRTVLSEKSWRYLWTHPLDVIAVLIPAARPLKILSIFTQGTMLASRKGAVKTTQAVVLSVILLIWLGAVSILSAERGAAGAQIVNFGDAIWWALVTMTTVGYGDYAPVTSEGRIIATVLMLLGIALIGVVTASVAAWFISLTSPDDAQEDADRDDRASDMSHRVVELESKIDRLLEIHDAKPASQRTQRED